MKKIKLDYYGDLPKDFTGKCEFIQYGYTAIFKDGKYHNENGPAAETTNGSLWWFIEGMLHREDGPAVINDNLIGGDAYYLDNKPLSEEEHRIEMAKRNSSLGKLILKKTIFDLEEK